MSLFYESKIDVPEFIQDNETVGAGLSSWVHRLNAVAKCYSSDQNTERAREIAVYRRLGSEVGWHKGIMRYYGILENRQDSRCRRTPLSLKLRWAEQAAEAITFLHSKNVLHCDISGNNIFLDENLNALVGDFAGSSLDGEPCLSWYETSYCHPDIDDPSIKAEIFALGSTFYEILLGQKPFEGLEEGVIQESIRKGNFPSLETLPALRTVISKCWNQQYQNTAELLQEVKEEVQAISISPLSSERFNAGLQVVFVLGTLFPIMWWIRSFKFLRN